MKVSELIAAIASYPPNAEVKLAEVGQFGEYLEELDKFVIDDITPGWDEEKEEVVDSIVILTISGDSSVLYK
jgi:hypothetical protein